MDDEERYITEEKAIIRKAIEDNPVPEGFNMTIDSLPHATRRAETAKNPATRVFDPAIWYQTSRKFRHVARLPEGKTAVEALAEMSGRPAWAKAMGAAHAADYFCRSVASAGHPGLSAELTRVEWEAFIRAGGGTALNKHRRALAQHEDQLLDELRDALGTIADEMQGEPPSRVAVNEQVERALAAIELFEKQAGAR